jgi:hypothetical protein
LLLLTQAQCGLSFDQSAFQPRQAALLALQICQTNLQNITPPQGWSQHPEANTHGQRNTD